MMARKKTEINVDALDFKTLLEESVACSRLGRTIASFGATLTGREKQDANFVYHLLRAGREPPEKSPTTASISQERKNKKYSPTDAIKWFADKYPREAEPLLKRLKDTYDKDEVSVVYGVRQGKDLPDEYYVKVLIDILQIPQRDAA